MLYISPTNLLLLAAKQEPYKKAYLLTKNIGRIFWKKLRRMDQQAEKREDRESNKTGQKNKRGDRKVESNDSPEIPDRGETSDIPGLPSGDTNQGMVESEQFRVSLSTFCHVPNKTRQNQTNSNKRKYRSK